ncbi:MAG: MoaD/ThiS family protein [Flavobacteriales bacterium]|nr:MoaD/ThiS family protein [Flavobacteriales bacterium]HPF89175.1 MoaD/ThiS family protein [Flavobacteriales bacterium]
MQVMLFGLIAEKAGTDRLELQAGSLGELRGKLAQHINGFEELSHAIAVDRRVTHDDVPLSGEEEIAVLPPFAGG